MGNLRIIGRDIALRYEYFQISMLFHKYAGRTKRTVYCENTAPVLGTVIRHVDAAVLSQYTALNLVLYGRISALGIWIRFNRPGCGIKHEYLRKFITWPRHVGKFWNPNRHMWGRNMNNSVHLVLYLLLLWSARYSTLYLYWSLYQQYGKKSLGLIAQVGLLGFVKDLECLPTTPNCIIFISISVSIQTRGFLMIILIV
jgi:hypothetical protein